jgi:hypothetical protein
MKLFDRLARKGNLAIRHGFRRGKAKALAPLSQLISSKTRLTLDF